MRYGPNFRPTNKQKPKQPNEGEDQEVQENDYIVKTLRCPRIDNAESSPCNYLFKAKTKKRVSKSLATTPRRSTKV